MLISRKKKRFYTAEQYEVALRASALEYAWRRGYDLVRQGNRYYLREHDSMIFLPDGRWYWNSRNLYGRAYDFIRAYEGRSHLETILLLAGDGQAGPVPACAEIAQKPILRLPDPSPGSTGILMKYMTQRRGCDPEIVRELIRQKRLYISCQQQDNATIIRNAVFVSFDAHGVPRSGILRGVNYGSSFKSNVPGSDKRFPFEMPGYTSATQLAVFEAPIDAISHATLEKRSGMDWRQTARLALGGTPVPGTVAAWLQDHPEIRTIKLCFDNDAAGKRMDTQLRQELIDFPGAVTTVLPPAGKDWNQFLMLE